MRLPVTIDKEQTAMLYDAHKVCSNAEQLKAKALMFSGAMRLVQRKMQCPQSGKGSQVLLCQLLKHAIKMNGTEEADVQI
jgi:hypothetical protein